MRLQALIQQVRIRKVVPGIGIYGIKHHLTGDTMIAMPDVAAVGVSGDDGFGFV